MINFLGTINQVFTGKKKNNKTNNDRDTAFSIINSNQGVNKIDNYSFVSNKDFVNSRVNYREVQKSLKDYNKIVNKYGGRIVGIDTETLGGFNDKATAEERKMFGITEIAVNERKYSKGGKFQELLNKTYVFGLDSSQADYYNVLIRKYETVGASGLSRTEISTLERLSRYSGDFNNIFKINEANGLYDLVGINPKSTFAKSNFESGLNNLLKVGERQSVKTKQGKALLGQIHSYINNKNKETSTMFHTHNGKVFDNPVMNYLFESNGLAPINLNKHFDSYETLGAITRGEEIDLFTQIREFYGNDDIFLGNKINSLESLTGTFGTKISNHLASADIGFTMDFMNQKIDDKGNTLLSHILNKVNNQKLNPGKRVLTEKNRGTMVLRANKALRMDEAGMDFVTGAKGDMKTYLTYALRNGGYYNVNGLSQISVNGKQKFVMNLSNASGKNDENIFLFRDNIEDFQQIFGSGDIFEKVSDKVFSSTKRKKKRGRLISQSQIEKETENYLLDISRRNFESISNITTNKGFDFAKTMYKHFNEVSELGLNQSEIERIWNGQQIIKDGKTITKDMVLGGLKNAYGMNVPEWQRDFVNLYNVLEDTNKSIGGIVNEIDKITPSISNVMKEKKVNSDNAKEFIKTKQNAMFSKAIELMNEEYKTYAEKNIDNAEEIVRAVNNRIPMEKDMKSVFAFDFLNNEGGYTRIAANSQESVSNSLLNYLKNIGTKEKNDKTVANAQKQELLRIADDMLNRGLIDKETINTLKQSTNAPYHIAQSLGNKVSKIIQNAHRNYTPQELMNLDENIDDIDLVLFKNLSVKGVDKFDKSGRKINGKSYDNIVTTANDVIDYRTKAAVSVGDIFVPGSRVYKNDLDPELQTFLKEKLNYSKSNIETFKKVLYSKGGLVNKYNYGISLFEKDGKYFMSYTSQEKTKSMVNAIINGKVPENAIISELPQIKNNGVINYLKVGNMEKAITKTMNVYNYGGSINANIVDTVDEMLSGFMKTSEKVDNAIRNKDYNAGSKIVNNTVRNPLLNGRGFSGTETVLEGDIKKKGFIPTINDYNLSELEINTEKLINFIPELANNDSEVAENIKNIVGENRYYKFMNDWSVDIQHNRLKDTSKLSLELNEWIAKNMFNGDKLVERISKLDSINDKTREALGVLVNSNTSLLTKEHNSQRLIASLDDTSSKIFMGSTNNIGRPVLNSWDSSHNINIGQIEEYHLADINAEFGTNFKNIKDAEKHLGFKAKEVIKTEKLNNYVQELQKDFNVETGITGVYKQMGTDEIFEALNKVNREQIYDGTKHLYSSRKEFDNLFDRFLGEYKNYYASTHEQHGLINPMLKRTLFDDKELITQRVDVDFLKNSGLSINQQMLPDTIIGELSANGKTQKLKYNKEKGRITSIDYETGTLYIEPESPHFNEVKLGIGGTEKTIASYVHGKNVKENNIIQGIWNKAFEQNGPVHLVGNFETLKHEAGSVELGHYLLTVANKFNENEEGYKYSNYLLSKHFKEFGMEDFIQHNTNQQFEGNRSLKQALFDMINEIKTTAKDNKDINNLFANSILKDINEMNKDNRKTALFRRMQSPAFMPSSADLDGDGGVKISIRDMQILGSETGDIAEEFRIKQGDKYVKMTQPIIDYRRSLIEGSKDYESGMKQFKNIISATNLNLGLGDNAAIKEMDFDRDIILPSYEMTADNLEGTLFNIEDFDSDNSVYKLKLPERVQVRNAFSETGEMMDSVHLPILKSNIVGDMVYRSKAQYAMSDFLNRVQTLNEALNGNSSSDKSIKVLQDELNDSFVDMHKAFEYELKDKDGLVQKMLLSTRVDYSGRALASKTIAPIFNKDGSYLDDLGSKLYKNGRYEGGVFLSKSKFEKMGVEFDKIGQQISDENFRGDKNIVDLLKQDNLIDDKGKLKVREVTNEHRKALQEETLKEISQNRKKINEISFNIKNSDVDGIHDYLLNNKETRKIYSDKLKALQEEVDTINKAVYGRVGEHWLMENGIYGTLRRDPTFHEYSELPTIARLATDGNGGYMKHGDTFITDPFSQTKLNLDHDGDNLALILNMKDGKMFSQNNKVEVATRMWHKAQADSSMNDRVKDKLIADYIKLKPKHYKDPDEHIQSYFDYIDSVRENESNFTKSLNYTNNDNITQIAIKARHGKLAIGYVSNPNFKLRDIAENILSSTEDGVMDIGNIYNITRLAEQKMIDIKHIKSGSDELTPAGTYKNSIDLLASNTSINSRRKALEGLNESLIRGGIMQQKDALDVEKFLKGEEKLDNEFKQSIAAIHNLFQNEDARKAWSSDITANYSNRSDFTEKFKKQMTDMHDGNNSDFGSSEIIEKKLDLYNETKPKSKLNFETGEYLYNYGENEYTGKGAFKINEIKQYDNGMHHIDIEDMNTKKITSIIGENIEDLQNKIDRNFSLTKNLNIDGFNSTVRANEFKEALNGGYDGLKKLELKSLFSSRKELSNNDVGSIISSLANGDESVSSYLKNFDKGLSVNDQKLYASMLPLVKKDDYQELLNHGKMLETLRPGSDTNAQMLKNINQSIIDKAREKKNYNPKEIAKEKFLKDVLIGRNSDEIFYNNLQKESVNNKIPLKVNNSNTLSNADESLKNLYDTKKVGKQLIDNFKEQTRDVDLLDNERTFARNVMVDKMYNNIVESNENIIKNATDIYAENLANNREEAYKSLNWSSMDDIKSSLSKGTITHDVALNNIGNMKISFGQHIGTKIKDLSENDLLNIYNHDTRIDGISENIMSSIKDTKSRVGEYLNISYQNNLDVSNVTKNIATKGLESNDISSIGTMNDVIKEAAEQKAQMKTGKITNAVDEIVNSVKGSGNLKKYGLATLAALGMASLIAGGQNTANSPALSVDNKTENHPFMSKETEPIVTPQAPPTTNTKKAVLGQNGVNYKISANSSGNVNQGAISSAISSIVGKNTSPNLNIQMHSTSDKDKNDNWVKDKIKDLLGN